MSGNARDLWRVLTLKQLNESSELNFVSSEMAWKGKLVENESYLNIIHYIYLPAAGRQIPRSLSIAGAVCFQHFTDIIFFLIILSCNLSTSNLGKI